MTSTRLPSLVAALAVLAASASARAHDPAKVLQYISTKPDDVIVATNRGLIFGNLGTRDFKLLCNEIYKARSSEENVRFARLDSGRLLVASSDGLFRSDDKGCSWTMPAALASLSIPSLTRDASAPNTIYVTTYSQSAPFVGTVRVSRDGGETFSTLHTGADEYLRTLHAVGSNPTRLYVAGMLLAATTKHFVARSSDGGANWERSDIQLEADELDVAILAVNPKDPNELLARATYAEPAEGERLLWSNDAGRTFQSLGKVPRLMHATFLGDGSGAYVGSYDGLFRVTGAPAGRRLEAMPVAMTARISQILEDGGEVLAGGSYRGLDNLAEGVGVARSPALSFERWFDFNEVDEQVQCTTPAPDRCRMLWLDWQVENLGGTRDAGVGAADGGAADAGLGPSAADAGPRLDAAAPALEAGPASDSDGGGPDESDDDESSERKDDGCQLVHGATWRESAPWLLAAVLALHRRKRARASQRTSARSGG